MKIAYQWDNLPDFIRIRMPMMGSQELFTQEENIVRTSRTMFAYMICLDENVCNVDDWVYTKYKGEFITINGSASTDDSTPQKIYRKILPAGNYKLMTKQAAYLFHDDTGIILSNITLACKDYISNIQNYILSKTLVTLI